MNYLQNPSKEARTISPGMRLKNFLPTAEFTIELVKNPDTLMTPERIPRATFSDIFVSFLTLQNVETTMSIYHFHNIDITIIQGHRINFKAWCKVNGQRSKHVLTKS